MSLKLFRAGWGRNDLPNLSQLSLSPRSGGCFTPGTLVFFKHHTKNLVRSVHLSSVTLDSMNFRESNMATWGSFPCHVDSRRVNPYKSLLLMGIPIYYPNHDMSTPSASTAQRTLQLKAVFYKAAAYVFSLRWRHPKDSLVKRVRVKIGIFIIYSNGPDLAYHSLYETIIDHFDPYGSQDTRDTRGSKKPSDFQGSQHPGFLMGKNCQNEEVKWPPPPPAKL